MSATSQPPALTPATPPPRRRGIPGPHIVIALLGLLVTASVVVLLVGRAPDRDAPALPDYGLVPAFELVDQSGARFVPLAMAGHATVVNFIFTRCDNVCPISSGKMLEVQQRTVDLGSRVQMVSFSVDPAHDTPAVLAAYARDYHHDPARWRFVTGPIDVLRPLVEGAFMTALDDQGYDERGVRQVWHGEKFLLVDKDLRIRGFYDTDAPGLDRLIRHARYLGHGGR
jgi:protein SCO1/2